MRHNGILGKQHGKFVSPFRLLIFKIFFIHEEILEFIYQFHFFRAFLICTVFENQSRFFDPPPTKRLSRIVNCLCLCFLPDKSFSIKCISDSFEKRLSGEKYKRDGRGKFVTGFRFLIFKIFSFQDNLKSKLRHAVLL